MLQVIASAAPVVAPVVPSLKNVENIDITALGVIGLSLVNSTGVEKIALSSGNNTATITGLANLVNLAATNTTNGGLRVQVLPLRAALLGRCLMSTVLQRLSMSGGVFTGRRDAHGQIKSTGAQ